jgi:hypothetical protein
VAPEVGLVDACLGEPREQALAGRAGEWRSAVCLDLSWRLPHKHHASRATEDVGQMFGAGTAHGYASRGVSAFVATPTVAQDVEVCAKGFGYVPLCTAWLHQGRTHFLSLIGRET